MRIELVGLQRVLGKLTPTLYAQPLRNFFKRATLSIESEAKPLTPVDTGRLRGSITSRIDSSPIPMWATVGTNVAYGQAVHDGARAHFPPPSALEGWARRHGFGENGGFLVARAISRRGTKARPFLRDGMRKALGAIRGHATRLGRDIGERWQR